MKTALLTLVAVMTLSLSVVSARDIKSGLNRKAVNNLVEAIKSDNEGVRMQSIFLAGKYEVSEAVSSLKSALKNSSSPEEKILIALSLYRIGDMSGMNAVKEAARCDSNAKVRNRCALLYNDYMGNTVASVR